jgi:hypothetical protein
LKPFPCVYGATFNEFILYTTHELFMNDNIGWHHLFILFFFRGFILGWISVRYDNVFYHFWMFWYFVDHRLGAVNWSLLFFAGWIVRSDMVLIPLTTLCYMWKLIDVVHGLLWLSYDPWYQKHGLRTRTVDWEPVVPP